MELDDSNIEYTSIIDNTNTNPKFDFYNHILLNSKNNDNTITNYEISNSNLESLIFDYIVKHNLGNVTIDKIKF
jgi:hypothetical protein